MQTQEDLALKNAYVAKLEERLLRRMERTVARKAAAAGAAAAGTSTTAATGGGVLTKRNPLRQSNSGPVRVYCCLAASGCGV